MLNLGAAVLLCLTSGASNPQPSRYHFEIDPERTHTDGRLELQFWTSGQLAGNFDLRSNDKGTKTKAGRGVFATDENSPVLATTYWSFEARTDFHTAGSFELEIDEVGRTASLSEYRVERLAEGPLNLTGSYQIRSERFRTLNPEAEWDFEPPLTGTNPVSLNRLKIQQVPGERSGKMTPSDNGWYRVSVTFMATASVDVLEFDQEGPMEFTVAASLVGNVKFGERAAEFGYPAGQGGDNLSRDVKVPMQDFKLVLQDAKGQPAHFRMFQTVDKFAIRLNGVRQFWARGTRSDSVQH